MINNRDNFVLVSIMHPLPTFRTGFISQTVIAQSNHQVLRSAQLSYLATECRVIFILVLEKLALKLEPDLIDRQCL